MTTTIEEKPAKTILNQYKHVDAWFWCKYSVNPYAGCGHACEYCDARSHKYHLQSDFAQTVFVKTNAPELLRRQIAKKPKDIVALSGVTDPYQPAEEKSEITRKCLEVLAEKGFPVFIATKSDLVLRDLDLLQKIQAASSATVAFTITTFDEKLTEVFEPGAPSPMDRMQALMKVVAAGIPAGVLLLPILPYLTDSEDNLEQVVRRARIAGAAFVLVGGLTMRDAQQDRVYAFLQARYPELVPKYKTLYKGQYVPLGKYSPKVNGLCREILDKHKMPGRIARPVDFFPEKLRINKRVAEALFYKTYQLEAAGAASAKIWDFREAAWAVDELKDDVRLIYEVMGKKGLQQIPGVSENMVDYVCAVMQSI
ncbi:MAG: radical SAM protein [Candidatus Margulisiibacteriota bacterium]